MSASSSPGGSPARAISKSQLPASIANASLEELQKLFVDSLKKLKARDKRIADLTANQEALHGQALQQASPSSVADLEQRLQSASSRAEEAERQASDAQAQSEAIHNKCATQTQQLEDAAHEKTIHSEQMASLKEVLHSIALEKDTTEKVHIAFASSRPTLAMLLQWSKVQSCMPACLASMSSLLPFTTPACSLDATGCAIACCCKRKYAGRCLSTCFSTTLYSTQASVSVGIEG